MKADIIVVGSLNFDLVVTTSRLPELGETVAGQNFKTYNGGKGFNQAVAASRTGSDSVKVAMVGKLGQDDFGNRLEAALQHDNIEATHVTRYTNPEVSTGVAVITVDKSGHNTIVVVPGTNFQIDVADIDNAAELFQEAKILLLQLEIPLEICQKAAEIAQQNHVKVMLTPAPVPIKPLPSELLSKLDWLILNETEVRLMATMHCQEIEANADETMIARQLIQATGLKAVIVTLGERGAIWVTLEQIYSSPAFPVNAVDTTAAGDTFAGALAAALAQNIPVKEALTFANAAAALSVTKPGASDSIPHAQDIRNFLK